MPAPSRTNLFVGLGVLAFALVVLFVWIPWDIETGITEKARRRIVIGDALAPTVAAGFLVLGSAFLLVFERRAVNQPSLGRDQLGFIARCLLVIVFGLFVMRYTGPLLADLADVFREDPIPYRILRATPGWKHIGFILGGVTLVAGLISVVERRTSWRALWVALGAVALMISIFDVPFEDLLLPPNGDV